MNDPVAVAANYFFLMQFIYYTPTCCVRTRCVYIFSCQVCISKSWIVQLHYSYRERFCMPGVFDGSESKQEFRFWCIEYTRTILHAREWNRACRFRYTFNSAFRERARVSDRSDLSWLARVDMSQLYIKGRRTTNHYSSDKWKWQVCVSPNILLRARFEKNKLKSNTKKKKK
jgi:hypothetical protein